ncbi:MAG: protein kinase [Myxococcales bacterium]|nr:protein kinase [Myxococcales bacterium]
MADPVIEELSHKRLGRTVKGKWRLDRLIGVGGMAAVYAATHRNGARVALKMLHATISASSTVRARFVREGYLANKVDHQGVVRVLDDDVDDSDGAAFLVMDLIEGVTLADRAMERLLDDGEVLDVAAQVLSVLTSAHDKGIVHRDLKPDNLLVDRDRQSPRPRLRHRPHARRRRLVERDQDRHGVRHAGLHGPRAGHGQDPARQRADRSLRPRGHAVRAGLRRFRARRREPAGADGARGHARAPLARRAGAAHAPRGHRDHRPRDAHAPGGSLGVGARDAGRHRAHARGARGRERAGVAARRGRAARQADAAARLADRDRAAEVGAGHPAPRRPHGHGRDPTSHADRGRRAHDHVADDQRRRRPGTPAQAAARTDLRGARARAGGRGRGRRRAGHLQRGQDRREGGRQEGRDGGAREGRAGQELDRDVGAGGLVGRRAAHHAIRGAEHDQVRRARLQRPEEALAARLGDDQAVAEAVHQQEPARLLIPHWSTSRSLPAPTAGPTTPVRSMRSTKRAALL